MKKIFPIIIFLFYLAAAQFGGCSSGKNLAPSKTAPKEKQAEESKKKEISDNDEADASGEKNEKIKFRLTSSKIPLGRLMPRKYTCQGRGMSPPFVWINPPEETQSFTMILEDPDAPGGDWVHWIIYNLPADVGNIPESITATPKLPKGALYGKNSWGKLGYKGPCPQSSTHRYFFKLYAVRKKLKLPEGATKEEVIHAMQDNIIAKTEFLGLYSKD